MNIDELAKRLNTTKTGLAHIAGISRSAVYTWDEERKGGPVDVRITTLLRMAENLEHYGGEAQKIAQELRAEARDVGRVVVTFQEHPDSLPERFSAQITSASVDGKRIRGQRAVEALVSHAAGDLSEKRPV